MTKKNNQHNDAPERDEELNKDVTPEQDVATAEVKEDKLSDEPNPDDVSKQVVELQQKYDELNDSYLRLHAEFDNFRKRTLK
jgi:molecular chaperone GrpE